MKTMQRISTRAAITLKKGTTESLDRAVRFVEIYEKNCDAMAERGYNIGSMKESCQTAIRILRAAARKDGLVAEEKQDDN